MPFPKLPRYEAPDSTALGLVPKGEKDGGGESGGGVAAIEAGPESCEAAYDDDAIVAPDVSPPR
jgi:hypothetical protein